MVNRKNDPNQIWFLTSVWAEVIATHPITGEIKSKRDTRTFGYYRGWNAALAAVKANRGNMQECLYQWLVMERIGEGVHALAVDAQWFEWRKRHWKPCKRPDFARGFTNWAIG